MVVVDTGWHPPAATDPRTPWMHGIDGDDELNGPDLRPYAGHGTFIAGVVRCVAPDTKVFVEGFAIGGVGGGGILESDLVGQLEEALTHDPQVINLSAGCRTRMDHPSIALDVLQTGCATGLRARRGRGQRLVVGALLAGRLRLVRRRRSLDRDGRVSDFSNFGVSADVYALGRNLVNAFPDGTFVCHESPDKGDVRVFGTGMARWSGTSFAAPVVAGLIARHISETGSSARDARDAVLATAAYDSDPLVGPHMELRQPSLAPPLTGRRSDVEPATRGDLGPMRTVNRTAPAVAARSEKKPTSSSPGRPGRARPGSPGRPRRPPDRRRGRAAGRGPRRRRSPPRATSPTRR